MGKIERQMIEEARKPIDQQWELRVNHVTVFQGTEKEVIAKMLDYPVGLIECRSANNSGGYSMVRLR